MRRTEGEHIVNIVGNTILMQVHRFAPSSRSPGSLKGLGATLLGGLPRKPLELWWLRLSPSVRSGSAAFHLGSEPPGLPCIFAPCSYTKAPSCHKNIF
jgi:hypothetical protein